MKKIIPFTILILFTAQFSFGQTAMKVYDILQAKCATSGCHNTIDQEAGLDLEGTGATAADRLNVVYNNLLNSTPANEHADAAGYKYIYPGRTDKSFLFRKINLGLEQTITMHAGEEQSMPPYGSDQLTDVEKEMVRQWILYGAPIAGAVVDEEMIQSYYDGNGEASFPDGPPEAPDPSEGFQIKIGPFFMPPGGEVEYFQKYELDLPENVDVDRFDVKISNYSHHYIMYRFTNDETANNTPAGLRIDANHDDISYVAAVAEEQDLRLPQGTAFKWNHDDVLDLNSHYINYSSTKIYQAEAYVNIYTQPEGTAAQVMNSVLVPNGSIYIPNNGQETSFTVPVTAPISGWAWALGGHTHKYGTGYKIWKQLPNGGTGDLIYDGSCAEGIPGCVSPAFDYQHIPTRFFDNFLHLDFSEGVIHQATYVNDGPEPVFWGATSDDEMMLFTIMFVLDTTGLNLTTSTQEVLPEEINQVSVYPNPVDGQATFNFPATNEPVQLEIFDVLGSRVFSVQNITETAYRFDAEGLHSGMYLYQARNSKGKLGAGKVFVR